MKGGEANASKDDQSFFKRKRGIGDAILYSVLVLQILLVAGLHYMRTNENILLEGALVGGIVVLVILVIKRILDRLRASRASVSESASGSVVADRGDG